MAITTSLSGNNKLDDTFDIVPVAMDLVSNYAVTRDTGTKCDLDNVTALAGKEVISFKVQEFDTVNTVANVEAPTKAKAVSYTVRLDNVVRTIDSADPTFLVEEPIVVTLNIRHQKSEHFEQNGCQIVEDAVRRLISCLYCNVDDTTYETRFADLMRGQERPYVN